MAIRLCFAVGAVIFIASLARSVAADDAAASAKLEGAWQGTLQVGATPLRLVIRFSKNEAGALVGKMDSVDQAVKDMPIDEIQLEDGRLRFVMKQIAGSYEGKLTEDGTKFEGTWKQGPVGLPLALSRTDKPAELRRPQEPKKPYPYEERDVTYKNREGGEKIAGTLTLPRGDGPFPAVLLVSGSGPQDRDEAILGHRPFLVLADYLTRRGIAVLRVDDRGVGGSTGNWVEATSEDNAADVLAGVAFLKAQPKIDPRQIGLIGHSEGGIIAPIAAVRSPDVAFIVLLAGTGLTGEEILSQQSKLIAAAMGASSEAIEREQKLTRQIVAVLKQDPDEKVADKLMQILNAHLASLPEEERKQAEALRGMYEAQIRLSNSRWFRFFLVHDPRPTLRQVKCPVLAVIGEHDLQVPADDNLREIEQALSAGGNRDHTVKKLAGLNHLFQTSATGSIAEYATIEETMSPAALGVIGDWIV
ncbi:MAG: alpha/beta fold hydrolase [Pirellulales bacterium]